ncbi:MAG: hypothetical protein MZW92_73485 [Comamonadaceae bacterium]|nr:hypothetical protein [Comamonadaceae bacterium]
MSGRAATRSLLKRRATRQPAGKLLWDNDLRAGCRCSPGIAPPVLAERCRRRGSAAADSRLH